MNNIHLKVQHTGLVNRKLVCEKNRGSLFSIEEGLLPFSLARVYVIYDIPDSSISRGGHAHKKTDQVIFVIKGSCLLNLDDGMSAQKIKLTSEDSGVRLGPKLWHSMTEFSSDCILLVAASKKYDDSDYIRDYEKFKQHTTNTI
jgi:uncharacterized cupin superfamily protein